MNRVALGLGEYEDAKGAGRIESVHVCTGCVHILVYACQKVSKCIIVEEVCEHKRNSTSLSEHVYDWMQKGVYRKRKHNP